MKVKDLLKMLEGVNPEADVEVVAEIESHRSVSICNDARLTGCELPDGSIFHISVSGEETDWM